MSNYKNNNRNNNRKNNNNRNNNNWNNNNNNNTNNRNNDNWKNNNRNNNNNNNRNSNNWNNNNNNSNNNRNSNSNSNNNWNNNNTKNSNNNRLSVHELQEDKEVLNHLRDSNESPEVKAEWFYQTLNQNKSQLTQAEQHAVDLDTENNQLKNQLLALTNALTETEKQWRHKEQALRQELQESKKKSKRHEKNFIKSKRENLNLKVRTAKQEELFNQARERCRQMGQNSKHRDKSLKDLQNQLVRYSKEAGEAKKELHESLQRNSYSDASVESLNDKLEEENSCLNEKLRRAVRMASAQDDALYLVAKGKSKEEIQNNNKKNGKNNSKRNSQQDDEMVDVLDETSQSQALQGFSQRLAAFSNYAKNSFGFDTAHDHDMAESSADPHNDPQPGEKWWRAGEPETEEEKKKRKKREIPASMVAQLWNQPRENMLVDQGSSVWVEEPRVPLYLPPTPTEPRFEARSRKRGFADFNLDGEAMAPDPILEMGDRLKRMRMGDLEFDFEWPSQAPESGFMAITKMLDDMNISRTYLDEITPETALEQFLVVIQTAMTTEIQRTPTIEELLEKVVWYLKEASAVNFGQLQSRLQDQKAHPAPPPPPLVPEARVISVKQPTEQASTAPTKVLPRGKTKFVGPSYLPPTHKPTMLRSSFPTTAKEWTKLSANQDYREEAEVKKPADPSEYEYVLQPHEVRDFRKFSGAIDFDPPKKRIWLRRLGYVGGFCALAYIALCRYKTAQNPVSPWMDSNEVPLQLLQVLRKTHFDEREIVQIMRYGAAKFADLNPGMLG